MIKNVFYKSIDRMLPSCFFCLEEKVKLLLKEVAASSNIFLEEGCYYFPDSYVVIPIENAVLPYYLSCIEEKYTFLLVDRNQSRIYCITKMMKEFLVKFRVPKNRQEIVENIQTYKDHVFFRESTVQGFLLQQHVSNEMTVSVMLDQQFNSQYTVVGILEKSNSSICYHVKNKKGQNLFLKQLLLNETDERKHFEKEISIIKRLQDDKNILKLKDFDLDLMYYVTEYIKGKNLEESYRTMTFQEKIGIINNIINVIANLHSRNIVHGDLHLGQFIISETGTLKLIDYETLVDVTSKHVFPYMGATFEYIEPESLSTNPFILLRKEGINFKAEVYRLGVLIYTIIYEMPPFHEITWKMLCKSKLYDKPTFANNDNKGHRIPNWIIEVIVKCLQRDPDQRFSSACEINKP